MNELALAKVPIEVPIEVLIAVLMTVPIEGSGGH